MEKITQTEYNSLQAAFEFLNVELFNSKLPETLITLNRRNKARGYFWPERFTRRGELEGKEIIHEIALNPDHFKGREDKDIISTLLHECTHLEDQVDGTAPNKAYHSKNWGKLMKAVGLYPSSTGEEGGKETGVNCSHYIIPDGAYAKAYQKLADSGFKLNWQSAALPTKEKAPKSKVKSTCTGCEGKAWAKPGFVVKCADCDLEMESEDA